MSSPAGHSSFQVASDAEYARQLQHTEISSRERVGRDGTRSASNERGRRRRLRDSGGDNDISRSTVAVSLDQGKRGCGCYIIERERVCVFMFYSGTSL